LKLTRSRPIDTSDGKGWYDLQQSLERDQIGFKAFAIVGKNISERWQSINRWAISSGKAKTFRTIFFLYV